jgi:hypothetical protein
VISTSPPNLRNIFGIGNLTIMRWSKTAVMEHFAAKEPEYFVEGHRVTSSQM